MRKQLYIGTVVVNEIGYKYTVEKVPSKEDLVEGELEESAEESDAEYGKEEVTQEFEETTNDEEK